MTNENPAPSSNRQPQNQQKWDQLAKRAQADEQLKQQLMNDPTPLVLKEGMEIPAGAMVRVVRESGRLKCIFETPKAAAAAGAGISESDLSRVVGGAKQLPSALFEIEDYSFDIEQVSTVGSQSSSPKK
jgi:hypothetical protein